MKKLLFILSILSVLSACSRGSLTEINLHAGAGLRDAVTVLIQSFEKENPNIKISVNYAGSGRLLGQIAAGNLEGVFMPGDDFYVEQAIKKKLANKNSKKIAAYFTPVIFSQKNNPKNIHSLFDFTNRCLRIGFGDERAAAIGKRALKIFEKNKIPRNKLEKQIVMKAATVNELGVAIASKTVDAVIIWDATARQFSSAGNIILIPKKQNIISKIPIIILKNTKNKSAAEKFVNFCTSLNGKQIWRENGYNVNFKSEK